MNDKAHTVSHRPTEYYSMCETSKRRIKEMQDQGISTKYDAKEKQEDVGKNDSYTFMMF